MEYFLTGRYALAIADLDRGLALYPGYSRGQPYFIKAVACERTGRTHEALVAYRLYLQKAPPDSEFIGEAKKRISVLEAGQ